MVLPHLNNKYLINSFVSIDCDQKTKNYDYENLISPSTGLNEKEVCNSLDFFSTKAPKKKQTNLKKISADEHLKNKRKRLENFFSTIDLDGWSDLNFVLPGKNGEDWHDDLHYIVLKQQERSNFLHQVWLFLMLALFCVLLISIAGFVYSKNSTLKNSDQTDSYEFIQKFINEFNHTDPKTESDPANRYKLIKLVNDESDVSWLQKEAKYLGSLVGNKENESLNLTKKAINQLTRSVEIIQGPDFKSINPQQQSNQVEYDLMMDESMVEKIEDKIEDSIGKIAKSTGFKSFLKRFQDVI